VIKANRETETNGNTDEADNDDDNNEFIWIVFSAILSNEVVQKLLAFLILV
jgi:hypothetical protein